MIRLLAPVSPLLLGVAILLTGQGLQSTLLPVRAGIEGFSTFSIGLMGAAYFLGFTLGCLRGVVLVQRVGYVRTFAAMTAAASAAPLLHGLWLDDWVWWMLRLITGFCFAVLYVVIESWLNEISTNRNRGAVFSAYTLITLTVLAVGQQMLLLYDPKQMALFAIASALVSLAALPVVLSTAPSPSHEETKVKVDLRRLYTISPAGTLSCLACGLASGTFWSLAPVYVVGHSSDIAMVAWFMTAAVLGGALGQYPLGLWSDRVDRRYVMAFTAFTGTAISTTIWSVSAGISTLQLMLLGAAWGAMAFPMYAVSVAHTNDYAHADEYVMVSGGLLLMYGIGAILGPFLAPAVMDLIGTDGLFVFTAAVHLLLGFYIIFRITRRTPVPDEEQIPFVDALASTQTASNVYEEEF